MNLELRLRETLTLEDTGDDFIARVMARVDNSKVIDIRTRRRSRFIVLATFVVAGAAAAMLAWQMSGSEPAPEMQADLPQPVMTNGLDVGREVAMAESPSPIDPGTAEPAAARPAGSPADAPKQITILVMPLAGAPSDASARSATEAFHSALLLELRRMPDLVLLDAATVSVKADAGADFTLTVTSLEKRRLPSGGVQIISPGSGTSGYRSTVSGLGDEYWPVEARIEEGGSAAEGLPRAGVSASARRDFSIIPFVGRDGAAGRAGCGSSGSLRRNRGQESTINYCLSTTRIAATLAEVMRQEVMDPAVLQQQLVAQLRNAALGDNQRRQALVDLLESSSSEGPPLDARGISAIVDFISGLAPMQRRAELQRLVGRKERGFVEPMLGVLRHDTDDEVRLVVLRSLMRYHGGEQPVLAAVEAVSRDDPQPIVRMAARRMLHGEAEWNRYVVSTLKDESLPYADRVQPLLAISRTSTTMSQSSAQDLLKEEGVAGVVVKLIREHMSDASQLASSRTVLALLRNVDRPEVVDLQLDIVQSPLSPEVIQDPALVPEALQARVLATEALQGLARRRDDPRVRKVLDQILAGELNPSLRFRAEMLLTPTTEVPR